MKLYDKVKLIKERAEYSKANVSVNDVGVIIGENRNGYVLVCFDGELYLDDDGIYKTTEVDLGVKLEDLEVIE